MSYEYVVKSTHPLALFVGAGNMPQITPDAWGGLSQRLTTLGREVTATANGSAQGTGVSVTMRCTGDGTERIVPVEGETR